MCVLSNQEMVAKAFFINIKKKYNIWTKKSFSEFKGAIFGIFEHTKTFFWQNVLLFWGHIHEKYLFNHFLVFYKTKGTWIEKEEEKIMLVQKYSFLEPNLIQKPT